MTTFSVATTERWKDKSGEQQERTEWHRVSVWGKLGEICAQYLQAGSHVYVEGKIQSRIYEKDGKEGRSFEIIANEVKFVGGKKDGVDAAPKGKRRTADDIDEDIPF